MDNLNIIYEIGINGISAETIERIVNEIIMKEKITFDDVDPYECIALKIKEIIKNSVISELKKEFPETTIEIEHSDKNL